MSEPITHHRPTGTDITTCCGKKLSDLPSEDSWSHVEAASDCALRSAGTHVTAEEFSNAVFDQSREYDKAEAEAFRRGAAFASNLLSFGSGQYAESETPTETHPMWREGYKAGREHLQRALSSPPEGWFTYGTHVDKDDVVLDFWGEDEDGLPLWERPKPLGETVAEAIVSMLESHAEEARNGGAPSIGKALRDEAYEIRVRATKGEFGDH